MISNKFDLFFICLRIMVINLEQRKIQIKLVSNNVDLNYNLNYNKYMTLSWSKTCAASYYCMTSQTIIS